MSSLNNFSKKCQKIYCYGIGTWGINISRYCRNNNIDIEAYIISDHISNDMSFRGKRVYCIQEVEIDIEDGIVFASFNGQFIQEMYANVIQYLHITKFYFLYQHNDIIKYFNKKFRYAIRKRRKANIFDYKYLSQAIQLYTDDSGGTYQLIYGIYKCVKKYTKIQNYDIRHITIDHGMRLESLFISGELSPRDNNIYVMSDFVWRNITNDINIYSLGPYILYTKPLLSYGALRRVKHKFKKTLLVFPAHSTGAEACYRYEQFIREIEYIKIKYKYESVIVCVYFIDIIQNRYNIYKKMGYKIVTAGHYFDSNFLNRLHTFILLSDAVITNCVGTHVGYCISLNKPVYIYNMSLVYRKYYEEAHRAGYRGDFDKENKKGQIRTREIKKCFSNYREDITQEQYDIIEKYWGKWNRRQYIRAV